LAFVSEPVRECLANLLQQDEALYPVEVQYGLMQLAEALQFVHRDGRLLHHNLCPENIIVNSAGAWKLSGFDFCIAANPSGDPNQVSMPRIMTWHNVSNDTVLSHCTSPLTTSLCSQVSWNYEEPDWSLPAVCRPYTDISAPEFHISQSASPASDMFSLGCLCYAVFNKGKPLLSRDSDPQAPARNLARVRISV
jgi:SCY1-like protein 2